MLFCAGVIYGLPDGQHGFHAQMVSERKAVTDMIAAGYHRDWPDGRGVFCSDEQDFFVWVNEKDHLRVCTLELGGGSGSDGATSSADSRQHPRGKEAAWI